MATLVERRLFKREEYHTMLRAGILAEDDPVELIDGEIVRQMPSGPTHSGCVNRLNRLLSQIVQDRAIVSVQNPLGLGEYSEPEPDLMLLRPRPDFYENAHPSATDALLVIEVADSSLATDRELKVPLYALHRVPEVWLIDLVNRQVVVYSDPADAQYTRERIFRSPEAIPLRAVPGRTVAVSDMGL